MEKFYEKGLEFQCKQCSWCCGNGPGVVYLSLEDLARLCEFSKTNYVDFIKKYCRWVMYTDGNEVLALQEDKQYRCILWKDGCSMYDARPVQCSTYPWWDWLCGSKEMWQECGKTCPGIGSQKMWTKEQIEEQIKLNSNNQPLRKDFLFF